MDLLTPEFGLFFWTLIAFLLVLFILGKFAWKPILGMLGDREKSIADSLAAAEKMRAEMGLLTAQNEKLLAEAREESTRMLREAKETRDKMVSEAKELAKSEANKIIIDAQRQIEQQKNAAITAVKNEIGGLAIAVAEKILRQQLNAADGQEAYMKMRAEEIRMN